MSRAAILAILMGIWPVAAQAQVLVADNRALLCTRSYAGRAAIDTDALAMLIVNKAGATMLLDGANQAGIRDGSIQLVSTGASLSEPAYAVLNTGRILPANANRPFGPNVDLTTNKAAATARAAIANELGELAFLMDDDVHQDGAVTFRVIRRRPLARG